MLIDLANYAKQELLLDHHDVYTIVVAELFYSSCCWQPLLTQQFKLSQRHRRRVAAMSSATSAQYY